MVTATKDGMEKTIELEASKEAVQAAFENLMAAKDHFKKAAEAAGIDLKHGAEEQFSRGKARAEEFGGQVSAQANEFVHEKPLATIGIAFASGFLLSQMFERK